MSTLEIERKFLVKSNEYREESYDNFLIKQGFLNSNKKRTVRIRITKNKSFITVKGKSNKSGLSRFEWEKEISEKEAEQLLLLSEKNIIEKRRYLVDYKNHLFEIDEFFGHNEGLIIAEVELKTENEIFEKPRWIGKEITGITKYYNSNLGKKPFSCWKK